VAGAQANISIYPFSYCSTSNLYVYEAVRGQGGGYAQAGFGVGAGIGGPHMFTEYFASNGTNYGPYIYQGISNNETDSYKTVVFHPPYTFANPEGDSYFNGQQIDGHGLDASWLPGTGVDMLAESYDTGNHWNAAFSSMRYCTLPSGGGQCSPGSALNANENYRGDSNACWISYPSDEQDLYDKRDTGTGSC